MDFLHVGKRHENVVTTFFILHYKQVSVTYSRFDYRDIVLGD